MRQSVMNLLDQAQKRMGGYVALCNFRLSNLVIKADPMSLLNISALVDREDQPLENVAKARIAEGREDQFEIFPIEREFLFPILKGIKVAHPEFDIEVRNFDDNEQAEEDEKTKFIVATMPVVDDNRHDVLTQGVKTFSDVCNKQLEEMLTRFTAEITVKLVGAPADELDEAKNALQELHDKHKEIVASFCDEKNQEIEDAYAAWQAAQAEKDASQQEADAAHNALAGLGMKMNPDEEENE